MSDPVRLLSTTRDGTARALLDSALSPGPTNAECDAQWSLLARKLPQAVVVGAAAGTAGGALAKVGASKAVGVGIGALVKGAVLVAVLGSAAAVGLTRPWESRGEPAYLAAASSSASSASSAQQGSTDRVTSGTTSAGWSTWLPGSMTSSRCKAPLPAWSTIRLYTSLSFAIGSSASSVPCSEHRPTDASCQRNPLNGVLDRRRPGGAKAATA